MTKEQKIIEISDNIMEIFQDGARCVLNQHQIMKAFNGIEWNTFHNYVLDYICSKMKWVNTDENCFRFSLTDDGNKYLDEKYGDRNDKIKEISDKIMIIFENNERNVLNQHQIMKAFNGIEWNTFHNYVLDYICNKMKWVNTDENCFRFSLTDEGNKYIDNL